MEDGLVLPQVRLSTLQEKCLNPYCSGRWSRTLPEYADEPWGDAVLILIVVEDGLVLSFN